MSFFIVALIAALTLSTAAHKVSMTGINLPGLSFGMSVVGSAYNAFESADCNATYSQFPAVDIAAHYDEWHAAGFNTFRVPFGWQYVQTELGGSLNETTVTQLDTLVDHITSNGSYAILDLHNYGRWYCNIIGQSQNSFPSGPENVTDEHLVNVWTRLATRYGNNSRVLFEVMNEPHDMNATIWRGTVQKAINAIRTVAPHQPILVPGVQYARLTDWITSSVASIGPGQLYDPSNNLIWDFHQYFDDSDGSFGYCEDWGAVFEHHFHLVTTHLRRHGATAALTEFGANGIFKQCTTLFDKLLTYLDDNADVWKLWTAWGAYNPSSNYLTLAPGQGYPLVQELIKHAALR